MESDVLHMVSPYQKRVPGRAPSEVVVSGNNATRSQRPRTRRKGKLKKASSPRVLNYEAQIVLPCKFDSFLDIFRRSCLDTDYRHVPLSTRKAEGGVEITALDRPVGKGVRLVVCMLSSTRLIGTPDSVEPASLNIGTVPCGRVVAWGGRWGRMDQGLGDFGCESLELRV